MADNKLKILFMTKIASLKSHFKVPIFIWSFWWLCTLLPEIHFVTRLFSYNNVTSCLCAFAIMLLHSRYHNYVIFLKSFLGPTKTVGPSFHWSPTALHKSISTGALILVFQMCLQTSPLLDCDLLEGKGALLINQSQSQGLAYVWYSL